MATSATVETPLRAPVLNRAAVATASVPWFIWCTVIAVTSAMIGGYWDISWHMSIGRDSFWTPPHLAIYSCGVLAGFACGYLILSTTFVGRAAGREASVGIWGFRGPLGAFICAWGGVAMITSGPFDNWWHNAYGLDVKIFSPPHLVLDTGILAVQIGTMVLIAGAMNRAEGRLRKQLERLLLYLGATTVTLGLTAVWEYTYRVHLHNSWSYLAVSIVTPFLLAGMSRATGRRWAATTVATTYTAYLMVMMWIFPLFPAEPRLGPVYQPIRHFVPLEFPLLILVPALFLDYLWDRTTHEGRRSEWRVAALSGTIFLLSFVAVEWPFGSFLMSPGARNWFFGTHYFAYFQAPHWYAVRYLFYFPEHSPAEFWLGMTEALGLAILSARLGLAWGGWMRRVKR